MESYVYRPEHPKANERGMVSRRDLYEDEIGSSAYVISDCMEPTRHMADGKYYSSKSKFREVTRAHGCIEVGNETATLLKPRKTVELSRENRAKDIKNAINFLRSR